MTSRREAFAAAMPTRIVAVYSDNSATITFWPKYFLRIVRRTITTLSGHETAGSSSVSRITLPFNNLKGRPWLVIA
jgi:hypothetical protein